MTITSQNLASEADFIAAERELAALRRNPTQTKENIERSVALVAAIIASVPLSTGACAVKLRLLAEQDFYIEGQQGPIACLSQVAAFLSGLQSRDIAPQAPSKVAVAPGEKDAVDAAYDDLDDAFIELNGLAWLIRSINNNDLNEALAYLGGQLAAHSEKAHDAFARLFGLNKYAVHQGGPGPLVVPSPTVEKGDAA